MNHHGNYVFYFVKTPHPTVPPPLLLPFLLEQRNFNCYDPLICLCPEGLRTNKNAITVGISYCRQPSMLNVFVVLDFMRGKKSIHLGNVFENINLYMNSLNTHKQFNSRHFPFYVIPMSSYLMYSTCHRAQFSPARQFLVYCLKYTMTILLQILLPNILLVYCKSIGVRKSRILIH